MRNRNSAAMMGRVRSKSNNCAFSNSSASEGKGVAPRVVAKVVAKVRDKVLGVNLRGLGMRGRVGVGGVLGVGGEVISVLEEAIIMLAAAIVVVYTNGFVTMENENVCVCVSEGRLGVIVDLRKSGLSQPMPHKLI